MSYASDATFPGWAIVPRPDSPNPQLLFIETEQGWSLPHWVEATPSLWHTTDHVINALRDTFGLETVVLRALDVDRAPTDTQTPQHRRLYEAELRAADWTPLTNARWVDRATWATLALAQPDYRAHIDAWYREAETGAVPALRPVWARADWFDGAAGWLRCVCAQLGRRATGPVEQLRAWGRSCVLRAPAVGGDLYLKALPPMFAFELPLAKYLSALDPDRFPRLVAAEPDHSWLLLDQFRGAPHDTIPELERWEAAYGDFARAGRADSAHPTARHARRAVASAGGAARAVGRPAGR